MKQVVNKKQLFMTVFCGAALIGLVYCYLSLHGEWDKFKTYLLKAQLLGLSALGPVTIAMYYAAGRIWYPYLRSDGLSAETLGRIQYELNFVNTVVPFLSISGLIYALARLKSLGVSEGKASGMYVFRYLISISTKWIEIAIAMGILIAIGATGEMPGWVVWLTCGLIFTIITGFVLGLILFQKKIRIPGWLLEDPVLGGFAKGLQEQMDNLFQTLEIVFSQKSELFDAFIWGMLYSFLEILLFWIIALSLGHPELLLQIIVASGVAITIGVIIPTPMGIGGFDGAMILLMSNMGSSVALASAISLATRFLTLLGTTGIGVFFWMEGMHEIRQEYK